MHCIPNCNWTGSGRQRALFGPTANISTHSFCYDYFGKTFKNKQMYVESRFSYLKEGQCNFSLLRNGYSQKPFELYNWKLEQGNKIGEFYLLWLRTTIWVIANKKFITHLKKKMLMLCKDLLNAIIAYYYD